MRKRSVTENIGENGESKAAKTSQPALKPSKAAWRRKRENRKRKRPASWRSSAGKACLKMAAAKMAAIAYIERKRINANGSLSSGE
jgi:hypothetical protein